MTQPVLDRVQQAQAQAQQRRRRQAITALILLIVGTALVATALWVVYDMWRSLLFLGIEFVGLGILIGLNN